MTDNERKNPRFADDELFEPRVVKPAPASTEKTEAEAEEK